MTHSWETALQSQLDEQRRKVDVDHFDITVRELVRMAGEGELLRAPVYQRKFRWDEKTESRLIESVFLGLPVPSLFVATNADGTWEVIDGLQRLSTLLHYVAEPAEMLKDIGKTEPLRIAGLEKLEHLNQKTLIDLPMSLQLAFMKRSLRVTGLSDKSDREVRFEMFERLNTGGVALTPQEVRACIFRGRFNDFLRELAEYDSFRRLIKLQQGKQEDGTREEIVLKFFAYLNNRGSFDGHVTKFLNDYMKAASAEFDYTAGRKMFREAADRIAAIVDGPILRSGYHSTPLNQLEAILVGAAENILNGEKTAKPKGNWLQDADLVKASTKGTNTVAMLNARIVRAAQLLAGKVRTGTGKAS